MFHKDAANNQKVITRINLRKFYVSNLNWKVNIIIIYIILLVKTR